MCFITGVPGSGKTLVGLTAVHHPDIRDTASFLSGNGPLVKILREALIRDDVRRGQIAGNRRTRRAAETAVCAFIQSVHRFADDHYKEKAPTPAERVIVFDEAQRAWDSQQNERAKRPAVSEAHMMMDVMNRHAGWCVLVCLVGGGQEINRGEAGLPEWGAAVQGFDNWKIYTSPDVLTDRSGGPFSLFSGNPDCTERIMTIDDFHLKVSNRSIRAIQMSKWVDAVLDGDRSAAEEIAGQMSSPPVMARNLASVRQWLREKRRGLARTGLVASSGAARLRPDGLETSFDFHQRFEWERWFLDRDSCEEPRCDHKYCNDVRSSSKLEVAATQFEIQGLELDWIGVCWNEDLLWTGTEWLSYNFNGKTWKANKDAQKHKYRVNGYRVLLTRARQGMIIYVPKPDSSDSSRLHRQLELTAQFLVQCGVDELFSPSSTPSDLQYPRAETTQPPY
ncbi:MAG TPA: DNA/RNA helicase domain-containing protein [Candidatus Sulfotelmatobacter sp.]|nr:DNA/RNA helicase domain-containing protein [Candidatus Sulfotelmatobacter sp.]HEV2468681.1 DNA/RNA helicase domain-containing protein [Candidatus Sulfotelmatobacter sp.]